MKGLGRMRHLSPTSGITSLMMERTLPNLTSPGPSGSRQPRPPDPSAGPTRPAGRVCRPWPPPPPAGCASLTWQPAIESRAAGRTGCAQRRPARALARRLLLLDCRPRRPLGAGARQIARRSQPMNSRSYLPQLDRPARGPWPWDRAGSAMTRTRVPSTADRNPTTARTPLAARPQGLVLALRGIQGA